jgi:hypothetical protein
MNTYRVTTRNWDSLDSKDVEVIITSDTFRTVGQNAEGVIFEIVPTPGDRFGRYEAVAYCTGVQLVVLVPTKKSKK